MCILGVRVGGGERTAVGQIVKKLYIVEAMGCRLGYGRNQEWQGFKGSYHQSVSALQWILL